MILTLTYLNVYIGKKEFSVSCYSVTHFLAWKPFTLFWATQVSNKSALLQIRQPVTLRASQPVQQWQTSVRRFMNSDSPRLMVGSWGHESHTHTRVAVAESGTGRDAWKKGKFPLRDGQGTGLSQARRQNVHFISGKVLEKSGPGQVLWGPGKAHKSASQGAILIHLNQEMEQGSKTTEVSSKWTDWSGHYSSEPISGIYDIINQILI